MGSSSVSTRLVPAKSNPATATPADYALNVVLLYQDTQTRQWAREVYARVTRLLGKGAIRSTWWNLHELNEPAVLAAAVSTTMRSDVIVVAIRAAEELPLAFYVWADTWLPHRPREAGALVALIGLPDQPHSQSDRARQYLKAVAQRGGLDFLVEERKLSVGSTSDFAPGDRPVKALIAMAGCGSGQCPQVQDLSE